MNKEPHYYLNDNEIWIIKQAMGLLTTDQGITHLKSKFPELDLAVFVREAKTLRDKLIPQDSPIRTEL